MNGPRRKSFPLWQWWLWVIMTVAVGTAGCQAHTGRMKPAPNGSPLSESPQEVQSALKSMTEALSGQNMTDAELQQLGRQWARNAEVRNAVESVTGALSGQRSAKYCPVDGKRFSPDIERCPYCGAMLLNVEE